MEICADCEKPLVVHIDPDSEDKYDSACDDFNSNQSYTVDDDVELQCGCHFHWWVKPLTDSKMKLLMVSLP